MFRYFKRQYVLVLAALGIRMAGSIIGPVSALLEKNMIDYIIQGNMEEFRSVLWYVALMVLAAGAVYYGKPVQKPVPDGYA